MLRFGQNTKVEALKRAPLFEGLTRKQLALVARLTDDLEVPPGTVLCKEGSVGHEFFVIIDGDADVRSRRKRINKIGPGDFFGEVALLEHVKRTATVTALTTLKFFVVSDQAFRSLLDSDPDVQRRILLVLARRVAPDAQDPTLAH